jgi:transposase
MRATRKRYTEEFKSEALALMDRDDRSYQQLSEDLGVTAWTLRSWYKQREMAKKSKGKPKKAALVAKDETPEQKVARLERDNERLRRQNEQLLMDREILKKAAAFFAKEKE